MDYDKLTDEQLKKLKSIERRFKKAVRDVEDMGFQLYLDEYVLCIMDDESHDEHCRANRDSVLYSFFIGFSGGAF